MFVDVPAAVPRNLSHELSYCQISFLLVPLQIYLISITTFVKSARPKGGFNFDDVALWGLRKALFAPSPFGVCSLLQPHIVDRQKHFDPTSFEWQIV
jgi:hypothetical protein